MTRSPTQINVEKMLLTRQAVRKKIRIKWIIYHWMYQSINESIKGSNYVLAVCNPRCLNGGACVSPKNCQCPSTYTGSVCQTREYLYQSREYLKRIYDQLVSHVSIYVSQASLYNGYTTNLSVTWVFVLVTKPAFQSRECLHVYRCILRWSVHFGRGEFKNKQTYKSFFQHLNTFILRYLLIKLLVWANANNTF
jgi:hypothetical protein